MFLNRLSQSLFLSFFLLISFFVSSETLTTYYHTDVLGSAVAASDEKKRVLWQEAYQPFGKKRIDDDNENRIGFTGHVYDDELNLVYMQARFYDPLLGRFMGVDPIGVDTNNPHSFNRYAYANNNPYRFVDPDGNIPVDYLIDGISLSLSAAIFANDPSVVNGLALFGDTVLAALPYVPAGIGIVRSGDKVVDVVKGAGKASDKAPDFVVSPGGTAFPVPKGASGPSPVVNPGGKTTGSAFTGGKGGANGKVDTMRIMNPTPPRGNSPGYRNGYIKYENKSGQGVDPYTGRTLSNKDSHFPID